jgi:hypothetical protein
MTDLAALHAALDAGARACHAAEGGDSSGAFLALLDASYAADAAFDGGSDEAEGFISVLDAISAEAMAGQP